MSGSDERQQAADFDTSTLFRPQVLDRSNKGRLGPALDVTSPPSRWWALAAALLAIGLMGVIQTLSYTRTVRVNGLLAMSHEPVTIRSLEAGWVGGSVPVQGNAIRRGESLLSLSPMAQPLHGNVSRREPPTSSEQDVSLASITTVAAPVDGVIASVLVEAGQWVDDRQGLVAIYARGSQLELRALAPAHVVGRLTIGQIVPVSIPLIGDATGGQVSATVYSISELPATRQELESKGRTNAAEPLYEVKAHLNDARLQADCPGCVRAGLPLEVQIPMDRRTLAQWIFHTRPSAER